MPLPGQKQRGRRQQYCSATCRSAARRARARSESDVANRLTTLGNGATIDDMLIELDAEAQAAVRPALTALRSLTGALASRLGTEAVAASRELAAGADLAMRIGVNRARSAGRTWVEIGDALHCSRQSAFQRFGQKGTDMTSIDAGAGERARVILTALASGDFLTVQEGFDNQLAAALDESKLAGVWANVTGMVGCFERLGEPFVRPVGDHTVIDVPMCFEAGDMVGRLAFDQAGRTAGLFIVRPEALG